MIVALFDRDEVIFTDLDTIEEPVIRGSDPYLGSFNPDAVLVLYSNFTCPTCREMSSALKRIVKDYNITLIWKDIPNDSLNPESTNASIAAHCANEQGAFWDFHDLLLANQNELGSNMYQDVAAMLGLRAHKFNRCLKDDSIKELINTSIEEAEDLEVTAPPTLIINDERFTGMVIENELRELLDVITGSEL